MEFDYYELRGVLTPGATVLLFVLVLFPSELPALKPNELSVGEFGILLLGSYIAGHLLQAIANQFEDLYWKRLRGGWPSDWVRSNKKILIAPVQREALSGALHSVLRLTIEPTEKLSERDWQGITNQMRASVQAANRDRRLEVFNSNYGLFRGMSLALLLDLSLVVLNHGLGQLTLLAGLVVAVGLSLARMDRFSIHYSRELFAQFLQLAAER